jgi:hypothetical protein
MKPYDWAPRPKKSGTDGARPKGPYPWGSTPTRETRQKTGKKRPYRTTSKDRNQRFQLT